MEPTNTRKNSQGNIINKLNKNHHISFKENFAEIINVESFKVFDCLNDKNEYYDEECYEDDEEEDKDKFDIQKYKPIKLERMANHDPLGYSKAKCIIM